MLKYHMGLLPTYLRDIFVTKSLKYNLRTENNIPNFNTFRYGKHLIRYFGPYLWSKLLKEIRNILSVTMFRSRKAGTKVRPDQLRPPVRVGSTRINSDQLGSNKKIKLNKIGLGSTRSNQKN